MVRKAMPSMVFIVLILNGCTPVPESDQQAEKFIPAGVWSYVLNDSVYGEVIFLEDRLWERHPVMGEFDRDYSISNDSLAILDFQGYVERRSKIEPVSADEFVALSEDISIIYYRIASSHDGERVANRIEPDYSDYLKAFEKRYSAFNKVGKRKHEN